MYKHQGAASPSPMAVWCFMRPGKGSALHRELLHHLPSTATGTQFEPLVAAQQLGHGNFL